MDDEVQLIRDGDGLAVIGSPTAVERFLASEGLPSRELDLHRLVPALGKVAAAAQAGFEIAANSPPDSGRWVKLTKESAQLIDKYGLRQSSSSGVSTGVIKGKHGQIKGFVEFASKPGRSFLANPALLAGVAGIMAQLAMRQAMDEITDYLAMIDEKVDDVLRAQKDAVLAQMIGLDLVIEDAMTIRAQVGRVSEVTWSRVQTAPTTIAATQVYALRQLDALAEKVEHAKIGDLAAASKDAAAKAREWFAVLARCFQLQDAVAVLELDRILDAAPGDLDKHRLGLRAARQNRLELISGSTERLVTRMHTAASTANANVLLHPTTPRDVVHARNHVETIVVHFHGRLGIESGQQSLEARRWAEAATEAKDKALEMGAAHVDAAWRFGNERFDRARSATGKLSGEITQWALRLRGDDKKG